MNDVQLLTAVPSLIFSSQLPDITMTVSDDNEVEVSLETGGQPIFRAVHFPYGGQVTVHDLRSVVEYHLRQQGKTFYKYVLKATHGADTSTLCEFEVIFLEHLFTGDLDVFLRNNFLTNTSSKMTDEEAVELLHLFVREEEHITVRYEIVSQYDGDDALLAVATETITAMAHDRVVALELSTALMRVMAELPDNTKLLAYSVHAGQRAYTFYVAPDAPEVVLYCRNAFNVWERCALHAVITHRPKVERSIAVTHRLSTFYNQSNEKEYEVETSGLTMEQARWIEQLFYSHDVRMGRVQPDGSAGDFEPEQLSRILITDFDCQIHDRDGELNTVKFTYQYQDRRTYLPEEYLAKDYTRIFTEPYDPTFN